MPFLGQIMDESSIDLATKELVIMRVSQLNGCAYCLAAHRPVALARGRVGGELAAVAPAAIDRAAAAASARSSRWVDQVTRDAGGVTTGWSPPRSTTVRDHQLIELTVLAGTITMLNQYCTAFQIPPPGADL